MKLRKKYNKKWSKTKEIIIKRMETKFQIKINLKSNIEE